VFIALDATSKAVLSYVVGKRTPENAEALLADLRRRVLNRPQLTSDEYAAYPHAVNLAFGRDVDYAQLVKVYQAPTGDDAAHRYSPGRVIGAEKKVIFGNPDPGKISTSYVERFNLTNRLQMRRFTRLTNGFSKKLSHHRAAVALHMAWYDFTRVHESLRVTPAMALRVTDHIWTIGELIQAALSVPVVSPPVEPEMPKGRAQHAPREKSVAAARAGGIAISASLRAACPKFIGLVS
jgi:IS1 family transposase